MKPISKTDPLPSCAEDSETANDSFPSYPFHLNLHNHSIMQLAIHKLCFTVDRRHTNQPLHKTYIFKHDGMSTRLKTAGRSNLVTYLLLQ
jgi:hypothetical protein